MREKSTLKTRIAISTAIVIFAVLVCTSVVSGGAEKISPIGSYIGDGEVSINLLGLGAGNEMVNISFSSTNLRPTATPAIQMTNFPMPFEFVNGWTNITGTNTAEVRIDYKGPDGVLHWQSDPTTIKSQERIKKQTYQLIKFSGTPAGPGDVGLRIWMNGTTAAGANNPANLRFTPQGVSSGSLSIGVYNGNTYVNGWSLVIGSAPLPDYGSDTGGGPAPSGPAAAPVAAVVPAAGQQQVTMLIAPQGQTLATYSVSTPTEATVDATVTVEQGTTITDPNGNFVNTVSIEQVSPADVPSITEGGSFAIAGTAVNCGPEGVIFSEPATLTFSLTQEQWDLAMAQAGGNPSLIEVQYYDKVTQSWVGVPTSVNILTHEVTALVDHFSLFALVVVRAPSAAAAAAVPTTEAAPAITREPTTLLAKPPVTAAKTTPAPFVSVPLMIGVLVVAGLAYTLGRKR